MDNKILTIFLLCAAFFTGCINKEDIEQGVTGNDNVIINFSVQGNVAVKSDDPFAFESKVTHLDLFCFNVNGNENSLYHYERIYTDGELQNNVVQGLSLKNLKNENKTLKFYIVANSTKSEQYFKDKKNFTISDLKNELETTTYINITGFEGLDVDAPKTFLMTGLATKIEDDNTSTSVPVESSYSGVNFTNIDPNIDLNLQVILVRSAAKVEITFQKKDNSANIYSFGKPAKQDGSAFSETELANFYINSLGNTYSYDENSYYLRNLRYETTFWGGATNSKRKTNPLTNNGYLSTAQDNIKVTTYIYSCSWGTSGSVFETAPFLIVNIPMVVYHQKDSDQPDGNDNSTGMYLAQNFYEIPLRQLKQTEGNNEVNVSIESNHYYKINAIVDAPGSQSSLEPFKLEPVKYEAYPWNSKDINVGVTESATYLSLNTNAVEMRGTNTNSQVKFSSSSPIKSITYNDSDIYYINKFGKKITAQSQTTLKPKLSFSTDDLSGNITVTSNPDVENVVVYMTFTVTNYDNKTTTFTVTQYPTVYIQGVLSSFSYRQDFGADYDSGRGKNGYISAAEKDAADNGSWWTLSSASPSSYTSFQSKVVSSDVREDGTALMKFYYWYKNGKNYSLATKNISNTSPLYLNPRMYHVTITSTSPDYKVGRPKLDSKGCTDISDDNNLLVSPSFMIASGLGATLTINSPEAARDHCMQYAEAYKDGNGKYVKLEDWRLPTEAEILVIVKFQRDSEAMDEVLTGKEYHCANGSSVATGITDNSNTALRCIRDVYTSPAK